MEVWQGLTYDAIMSLPLTVRHRLIKSKVDLERQREERQRSEASQARSRVRR